MDLAAGLQTAYCRLEAVYWPGFGVAATQIATAAATVAAATACFTNGFHVQCVMFLGKDCFAWLVMAKSGLEKK